MTQTAIPTPRGRAEIPLESAHKFTSTCPIREQFPSSQRKVVAGVFPGFYATLPSSREANTAACADRPAPLPPFFALEGRVQ